MKVLFTLFILFTASNAFTQDWEVSIAPAGLSNYDNWFNDRQVHVKDYQYSFFASGFVRFTPANAAQKGRVHWHNGIGLSYSFHQAHWEYNKGNGVSQPTSDYRYTLQAGIVSAELTPLILEFKNGLEIRSGLLIGVLANSESNFPRSKIRVLNMQLANRISYQLNWKQLKLLPFYQFSTGLLREVTFGQTKPLLLHRHNVGITFKLGGQKEL